MLETTTPSKTSLVFAIALWLAASTVQADLMIYPQKGQSAHQQSKDRFECHNWAMQQSGFDPTRPQSGGNRNNASNRATETLRGGARGAAGGAAIGAIAGNAGRGAAIGAVAGGLNRNFRERDRQRAEAANPSMSPGQQAYNRGMAACLQGRGYSVQ